MRDYEGPMEYFQAQLEAKGITKDMFDITDYVGLSMRELQNIVDSIHVVQ